MTTETILTDKEISKTLVDAGILSATQDVTAYDIVITRAIEQAVLQSPEIQSLRKDAERYQWLRDKSLTYSGFQADGVDGWIVMRRDSSLRRVFSYTNTDLDDAVDAAMEKQK